MPVPSARVDPGAARARLREALIAGRNQDGGWGYYAGKASRIEPTCWAILALAADGHPWRLPAAAAWLMQCRRSSGWLVEHPDWPVNVAFNALAAFTLQQHPELGGEVARRDLLSVLTASRGVSVPQSPSLRQDNSLQGWAWTDATFSWVEPTSWGLLVLKQARRSAPDPQAAARIAEAERLLVDRSCRPGGWNYGNPSAFDTDLRPYAPTTALALLALQDRRDEDVVIRGLAALGTLWPEEESAPALALSLLALSVYARPRGAVVERLAAQAGPAVAFGNHHGIALALCALSSFEHGHGFRLQA